MDMDFGPLSHQSKMLKKYTRYCLGLYVTILPLSKALYLENYSCNTCIVYCLVCQTNDTISQKTNYNVFFGPEISAGSGDDFLLSGCISACDNLVQHL